MYVHMHDDVVGCNVAIASLTLKPKHFITFTLNN